MLQVDTFSTPHHSQNNLPISQDLPCWHPHLQGQFCGGGQRKGEEGQGGGGPQCRERRPLCEPPCLYWLCCLLNSFKRMLSSQETPYFSHLRYIFSTENMHQQALYVLLQNRITFPDLSRSIYTWVSVIQTQNLWGSSAKFEGFSVPRPCPQESKTFSLIRWQAHSVVHPGPRRATCIMNTGNSDVIIMVNKDLERSFK